MSKAKEYDVIQIQSSHEWGGWSAVVEEADESGVQCYVETSLKKRVNCRVAHEDYVVVGKASYVLLWVDDDEIPVTVKGKLTPQPD